MNLTTNMSNEQQEKPKGVLFGILAYHTEEEYQSFLDKIKNGSEPEIVLVVNAALRFAQSKGAFSLEESELIINTLKIFSQENGEAESN
jgi:hypothetical protein